MTTILEKAVADIEAVWQKAETVAEADVQVFAAAFKSLATAATPSLWAMLLGLGQDIVIDLVTNPGAWMTEFLSQAAAAGVAEWNVLQPEVQAALAQAVAGLKAVTASAPAAA